MLFQASKAWVNCLCKYSGPTALEMAGLKLGESLASRLHSLKKMRLQKLQKIYFSLLHHCHKLYISLLKNSNFNIYKTILVLQGSPIILDMGIGSVIMYMDNLISILNVMNAMAMVIAYMIIVTPIT